MAPENCARFQSCSRCPSVSNRESAAARRRPPIIITTINAWEGGDDSIALTLVYDSRRAPHAGVPHGDAATRVSRDDHVLELHLRGRQCEDSRYVLRPAS